MQWTVPDPPLRSGEIALRLLRPDDAPAVVEACLDPAIARFTFMQEGLDLDGARRWIEDATQGWRNGVPRFAIVDATNGTFLGQVGVSVCGRYQSAELFYWVTPSARGRGVASSAVSLVCDWAFANALERLQLVVHLENDASHHVAARCGFTREGTLRGYERFKGRRPDVVSWSLLATDARPGRDD